MDVARRLTTPDSLQALKRRPLAPGRGFREVAAARTYTLAGAATRGMPLALRRGQRRLSGNRTRGMSRTLHAAPTATSLEPAVPDHAADPLQILGAACPRRARRREESRRARAAAAHCG